jgi:hypothetical protein
MTDRDLTPDEAYEVAMSLKDRIDTEVAIRDLRRAIVEAFRPLCDPILNWLQASIDEGPMATSADTPTERIIAEHGIPANVEEATALLRHALRPGAERWEVTGAADLVLAVCEREETVAARAREELARLELPLLHADADKLRVAKRDLLKRILREE